jgi:hypothetical protein
LGGGLALALALVGCRSCDEPRPATADAGQPPMPAGMLVPVEGGAAAAKDGGERSAAERLRITRGEKGGAFSEIQVAPPGELPDRWGFDHWRADSSFVSLDAMTLLHVPFARALPGFDLFLPRLFPPDALERLVVELAAFEKEWTVLSTLAQAKARWAKYSELVERLRDDAEWNAAKGALVETIHELSAMAKSHAAKKQSLWVLGP